MKKSSASNSLIFFLEALNINIFNFGKQDALDWDSLLENSYFFQKWDRGINFWVNCDFVIIKKIFLVSF